MFFLVVFRVAIRSELPGYVEMNPPVEMKPFRSRVEKKVPIGENNSNDGTEQGAGSNLHPPIAPGCRKFLASRRFDQESRCGTCYCVPPRYPSSKGRVLQSLIEQ